MNVEQLWDRYAHLKNEIKELEVSAKEYMDQILELQKTCDHEEKVVRGFPSNILVCKKCKKSLGFE